MDTTTATAPLVFVRRGNGAAIHLPAYVNGEVWGTRCALNVAYGAPRIRIVKGATEPTCKACLRIEAAATDAS